MNLKVFNEFPALQFPKFLKLRTLDGHYPCKEEATSANAQLVKEKGHFSKEFFAWMLVFGLYGRKPYTLNRTLGHSCQTVRHSWQKNCYVSRASCSFLCSISSVQMILCVW